ncbi:MAG: AAA family ATPase [Deltaproteobacteria bacterium]|nr:AAA family ATPase [Deltaproteobacteria bacterium]
MLTRLKVQGFKNLVDIDVRFGPFTCVAGRNGVGKSNLFDAILFLSDLTEKSLIEALTGVRGETRAKEAGRVFSRGTHAHAGKMTFEAEMIVPKWGEDDLGQAVEASATFLRYSLEIRRTQSSDAGGDTYEIASERLDYVKKSEAKSALPFARGYKEWRESAFQGRRTTPFISTRVNTEYVQEFKIHEDSGHQGRGSSFQSSGLARTLLSTIRTAESPTALMAKREMQSWRLLQLEPAHLRTPDEYRTAAVLGPEGRGLAATLNRLISYGKHKTTEQWAVQQRLVNRLKELVDVENIDVDRDEKRELFTTIVTNRIGTVFSARELSDGTLRFLALAALEQDPKWNGLLCMEEPENGIHPTRIPRIIDLLRGLTVDLDAKIGKDNPLRQVILNTHSPEVVGLVPYDSLLLADTIPSGDDARVESLVLRPLRDTWRTASDASIRPATKGDVLAILNALPAALATEEEREAEDSDAPRVKRVARRSDFRQLSMFASDDGG